MMTEKKEMTFSAFAVSLSGNRGAVSMLVSAIDFLTSKDHPGKVNVFTVYPKDDLKNPQDPNISVFNGSPVNLAFKLVPLCVLARICTFFNVKESDLHFGSEMRALLDTDVCLLIGGTTFSDAQPVKVLYNVLCMLPAIILKKKAMVYSQTLGPFKSPINRLLAKWCLSRMDFVAPRGRESLENVQGLNLTVPVENFADSAFSLEVTDEIMAEIKEKYLPISAGKKTVGISINSIVQDKCKENGIDHDSAWLTVIKYLLQKGYFVVLIPHSIRAGSKKRHNNDLLAVREIEEKFSNESNLIVIAEPYSCKELRCVVGIMDFYIACRFHSMISCICTGVPVVVYGWGYHKYREVMDDFKLGKFCHDAIEISGDGIISGFEEMVANADAMRTNYSKYFPAVRLSSLKNHETAWSLGNK